MKALEERLKKHGYDIDALEVDNPYSYKKGGGTVVKARVGSLITALIKAAGKKGKKLQRPKKVKYGDETPLQKQARRDRLNKQKAADLKARKKREAARDKDKKAIQQAKISEALRGAKVADRSKKTSQVAKRVLPHVSQVRNKLKGMSAVDLGQKYTGKELKAMEIKLKQADTPNKALLKRIEKARNFRTGMISSAETPSAHEALGLPAKWKKSGGAVVKAKKGSGKKTIKTKKIKVHPSLRGKGREEGWWLSSDRKKGGAIKRNKGGAVRGVGKATRGFGNAKYSKKLY